MLAKACDYPVGLWPRLICFLEHPELELSNNWAKNSMRPIAVEKELAACGQRAGGPKIAAILSIIESCRRLKIPSAIISRCPAWLMLQLSASPN